MNNKCEICGRKVFGDDQICHECRSNKHVAEIKTLIENKSIDHTDFEDEIICPYCGEIHEDDDHQLNEEGIYEVDCMNCGCAFLAETYVTYNYSTKRLEEEI